MQTQSRIGITVLKMGMVALVAVGLWAVVPVLGQGSSFKPPRLPDGKPDLNGIWQALNTANWDLQAHAAHAGPVASLGAAFSEPAGISVVVDGEIPYQPAALEKKKANGANWTTLDPEVKCYLPGVPRATYMVKKKKLNYEENLR